MASVFLPILRAWQHLAERYTDDELRLILEFYGQLEQVLRDHIGTLRGQGAACAVIVPGN